MPREPKYDILFEPIASGPRPCPTASGRCRTATAPARTSPGMQAEFRAMKAEGGWGAVFTEVCNVSHAGDILPVGRGPSSGTKATSATSR